VNEYAEGREIPEISDDQLISDIEERKEKIEEHQWLTDLLTELESEPAPVVDPKKASKRDKLLGKDKVGAPTTPQSKAGQSEYQNGDVILFKPGKPEKLVDKIGDAVIKGFQKIKKSSREDADFVHAGIIQVDKYNNVNVIHFTNDGPVKNDIRDINGTNRYQVGAILRCDNTAKAQDIANNAQSALDSHSEVPQRYSFGKAIKTLFQSSKISRETAADIEREVKNQQICSSFCMDVVNKTLGKDQTKHHATILPGELRTALESAQFKNVAKPEQKISSRKGLQEAYKKIHDKVIDPIKAIVNKKSSQVAEAVEPDNNEKKSPRMGK
jgi:hypothetical protein